MLQTSRGILSNPIRFLMQATHYPPVGFPKHSLEKNKDLDTKKKGPTLASSKGSPTQSLLCIHTYTQLPIEFRGPSLATARYTPAELAEPLQFHLSRKNLYTE